MIGAATDQPTSKIICQAFVDICGLSALSFATRTYNLHTLLSGTGNIKQAVLWNRNRNFLTSGIGTGTGTAIQYGFGTRTRYKNMFLISFISNFFHSHFTIYLIKLIIINKSYFSRTCWCRPKLPPSPDCTPYGNPKKSRRYHKHDDGD